MARRHMLSISCCRVLVRQLTSARAMMPASGMLTHTMALSARDRRAARGRYLHHLRGRNRVGYHFRKVPSACC
jgi:hypothetical protein